MWLIIIKKKKKVILDVHWAKALTQKAGREITSGCQQAGSQLITSPQAGCMLYTSSLTHDPDCTASAAVVRHQAPRP